MAQSEFTYQSAEDVISAALMIMEQRIIPREDMSSSSAAMNYVRLLFAGRECEYFYALFLDSQNKLIEASEMFRGTIDGAAIYPREVVKEALKLNASAVIFAHNHPSGCPDPSTADQRITGRLKDALALVDVRVLDHLVVGDLQVASFAERGIL